MAKPTGMIGPNKITVASDGAVEHAFQPVPFSTKKEEVEVLIANDFIASMTQLMTAQGGTRWFMSNPVQNAENDFDFTITLPDGMLAWLELMEIAPLHLFGDHQHVPAKYKPFDFAKIIVGMIMKKAVHYPAASARELHLLTYITHWGFIPSESLIHLVRAFLIEEKHPFAGIYLYAPFEAGHGHGRVIAPVDPKQYAFFNPNELKENEVINLNPAKWQL